MPSADISAYLRSLQEKTGWSVQDWSDASGIPVNTVVRVLSGKTENPLFDTVSALVRSAGGSLDELAGIAREISPLPPQQPEHSEDAWRIVERYIETLKDGVSARDLKIAAAEAREKKLQQKIARRNALIGLFMFVFGFFLAWDLLDPNYGFFYRVFAAYHPSDLSMVVKG